MATSYEKKEYGLLLDAGFVQGWLVIRMMMAGQKKFCWNA